MAKKWTEPILDSTDWGGDESTGGLPVAGSVIQDYLKKRFQKIEGSIVFLSQDEYDNLGDNVDDNLLYYILEDEEGTSGSSSAEVSGNTLEIMGATLEGNVLGGLGTEVTLTNNTLVWHQEM